MLGWIFDSSARATCRGVGAVVGHVPGLCLTNGGRPLLFLIAGIALFLFVLVLTVRGLRS